MLFKLIARYCNRGDYDPFVRGVLYTDEENFNIPTCDVANILIKHFDRGAVTVTVLPMERTV